MSQGNWDPSALAASQQYHQKLGTTPRKVWSRKQVLWIAAGAFALGAVIFGTVGAASVPAAAPVPAVTKTVVVTAPPRVIAPPAPEVKPTPKASPAAVESAPGDGMFLVGDDIQPGTYKSAGPADDALIGTCYWARLADTSGEKILANNLSEGAAVVTIKPSDKAFETRGCKEWIRSK